MTGDSDPTGRPKQKSQAGENQKRARGFICIGDELGHNRQHHQFSNPHASLNPELSSQERNSTEILAKAFVEAQSVTASIEPSTLEQVPTRLAEAEQLTEHLREASAQ